MSELTNERNPAVPFPSTGPLRLEGAGTLEAARAVATGQRVCVRRVPASAVARSAIEAAQRLPRHPALCAAIDSGTWEGAAWIATEFPEGLLLGDASAKVEDFAPIAEALAALHAHGVAHGLVSGEAVLISAAGKWLLHEAATLELNRLTDRRPEQTALAQLQRTAPFFSAQRLKGGLPTAADDVYALGALLCVATGGERLVCASALEQLRAVMLGEWKPRPAGSLPAAAARLITRMLCAAPAQRPSAKEVGEHLRTPGFVAPFVPLVADARTLGPAEGSVTPGSTLSPAARFVVNTLGPSASFVTPESTLSPAAQPVVEAPALAPAAAFVTPEPARAPAGRLFTVAAVAPIAPVAPMPITFAAPAVRAFASPYGVPAPKPTAPGFPSFDFPRAPPTAPDASPPVFAELDPPRGDAGLMFAPSFPHAAPTVPTPRRPVSAPLPSRVQLGGAATRPSSFSARLSSFAISIAASDARLLTAGLLAIAMLASTVALGAHVVSARQEAQELGAVQVLKPLERKEPRYNAEQLKQILRQKEEARHEY